MLKSLFEEPIYGLIGGYHFPVTASSTEIMGIGVQKYVGTGKFPWDPITIEEVQESIDILQKRNPQLVALSPHDSCETSIEAFRSAFSVAYRDIVVGDWLTVKKDEQVTTLR